MTLLLIFYITFVHIKSLLINVFVLLDNLITKQYKTNQITVNTSGYQ